MALLENGCISFEDFIAMIPEDLRADMGTEKEHFDYIDSDGNGKICEEELMALLDYMPANRRGANLGSIFTALGTPIANLVGDLIFGK